MPFVGTIPLNELAKDSGRVGEASLEMYHLIICNYRTSTSWRKLLCRYDLARFVKSPRNDLTNRSAKLLTYNRAITMLIEGDNDEITDTKFIQNVPAWKTGA